VTIYEKRPLLGGLNTTGVAPYKMRADASLYEVAKVLEIGGIDVKTGVSVPGDLTWDDLLGRHDALFLGLGLGPDSYLQIDGEGLPGVEGAVAFIERLKLGPVDLSGVRQAVVIGGGNTALDAVRELRGLGVPDVAMVYRGTEARMSGYHHEWDAAKTEDVRAVWQTQPVGFASEGGRLTGVRCVKLGEDRRPIPGSDHVIPAQIALLAVGQAKLADLVAGLDGVATDAGRISVGAGGATGRPGVFAGGDCVNGGKEVVNAVAEGRDAADAIHSYLAQRA
jgi:glutamate synthase (NADPH/NADH) small chain